jgi:hypothetical protein
MRWRGCKKVTKIHLEMAQLAGMNPGGAMSFLLCFSNVGDEER